MAWLARLPAVDPDLFRELAARHGLPDRSAVTVESLGGGRVAGFTPEALVAEGRPAFLVRDGSIADDPLLEEASHTMADRLRAAAARLAPALPSVGRIDVSNFPGLGDTFVGTGWLVEPGIVVTNRHVAERLTAGDATFEFRAGRFGDPVSVWIDHRHEFGSDAVDARRVCRVVWIEPDPRAADIAFLEVERPRDGSPGGFIALAATDPPAGTDVAVVGYPARAPAHVIPDQEWMRRVYRDAFDVKRISPGQTGGRERGALTHDCSTLGGNSGSVVLDLASGEAVGLHFAGEFQVRNYAVPASEIRRYMQTRPWQGRGGRPTSGAPSAAGVAHVAAGAATAAGHEVTVTIPLTITLRLGGPLPAPVAVSLASHAPPSTAEEAARRLLAEAACDGLVAARPGYLIENGRLGDARCVAALVEPERYASARSALPASFLGHPVVVRPVPVADRLGPETWGLAVEGPQAIRYDDDARTGGDYSLAPLDDDMEVVCHVGPDRGWEVLSAFLASAREELVSSMYEFHAGHVADAVGARLDDGASVHLALSAASRDREGRKPRGEFARRQRFSLWADRHPQRFELVFVPTGRSGLAWSAYHIKASVADRERVWLSSGNWKGASQPAIGDAERSDPRAVGASGNREWHVTVRNATLASRLRAHLRADFERALALGGRPEGPGEGILVDLPKVREESLEPEAMPDRVFEPLAVTGRVRLRPLLTPDAGGAVYCDAVRDLILSASRSLLFQNQYIAIRPETQGRLAELVDALVDASRRVADFRVILRSEGSGFLEDIQELKRRGLDVMRVVRRLPSTHVKGIVADRARVLVGSHNWSSAGVTLNRDASLLIDDERAAAYFAGVFEVDWERAPPLSLREPTPGSFARPAGTRDPDPRFDRVTAWDPFAV